MPRRIFAAASSGGTGSINCTCAFLMISLYRFCSSGISVYFAVISFGEQLCFCLWLKYQCSRFGFQCRDIRNFGLDIEQLLGLCPPRLAGREQIAKLACTLPDVSHKTCEDTNAAFLCGVSFVGRAFRVHLLFYQSIYRRIQLRLRGFPRS